MNKCPCGRPAATEVEHSAASVARKCGFCYDFDQYALTVVHAHKPTIHEHEVEQADVRFIPIAVLQTGGES